VLTAKAVDLDGWPGELLGAFHDPIAAAARLRIQHPTGRREVVTLPVGRWHGPVPPEEIHLLSRVQSPVLDVGCGPGRHVAALLEAGHAVLGIDVSVAAVAAAVKRGAPAVRASVFDDVPASGAWATALLLDGNIGIGGDPPVLLDRVHALLAPGGTVLVELDGPGIQAGRFHAHVEHDGRVGPRFPWARVGSPQIAILAAGSAFDLIDLWDEADRWFAHLERAESPRENR
jgi:SAM-dependent methyltransferase